LGADFSEVANLSAATLHEAAGRVGALPCAIRPLSPTMRICAPAFPVRCAPGSNLALHHAIYAAQEGDALIVDVGSGLDFGYWGEVMTVAAQARGLAGLVIAGGVRDVVRIREMGFPVFSAAVSLRGTDKSPDGAIGRAITIGDVVIQPGDLVFGDTDGVVVIPRPRVPEIARLSEERDAAEAGYLARLKAGESTLQIYGLPALANASPSQGTRRRSVDVTGLRHGHLPIPTASLVGPILSTGGVRGVDPASGDVPADPDEQCRLMFENLRAIVEAAGGTTGDIVKLTIWAAGQDVRDAINPQWVAMFPDPESRPSRHILNYALPGAMVVQCEALAHIETRKVMAAYG